VAANPFDFLTKQKLNNSSTAVAEALKASISLLEILKRSSLPALPTSKSQTDIVSTTLNKSVSPPREDAEPKSPVEQGLRSLVVQVDQLKEAAKAGEQQTMIDIVKAIGVALTDVISRSRGLTYENQADKGK
jgi:soluble cytochrome b562